MATILCIDDDPYLLDLLRYALEHEGFKVLLAGTGRQAIRTARMDKVHLVVLDSTLPDMSGLKVLSLLRGVARVPVIMLTTRAREEDVIASFRRGADDCVAKPFNLQVLVTRITAVLRRVRGPRVPLPRSRTVYQADGFTFDGVLKEVVHQDVHVKLTPTECRLLHLLFLHAGHPLSAQRILESLWGEDSERTIAVVKTHIKHLRRKIRTLPGSPKAIYTVPRAGYMVKHSDELSMYRSRAHDGTALDAMFRQDGLARCRA